MDILSYFVLNLDCKTVVSCDLIRFMLMFHEQSLIAIDTATRNHASVQHHQSNIREVTSETSVDTAFFK